MKRWWGGFRSTSTWVHWSRGRVQTKPAQQHGLAYSPDSAWDGLVRCTVHHFIEKRIRIRENDDENTLQAKRHQILSTRVPTYPACCSRAATSMRYAHASLYPNSHPALLSFYHSPPTEKQ